MRLRVKKDIEFIFRDNFDEFNHSKMIIKKNTLIYIKDNESEINENLPGSEFERSYLITFDPSLYSEYEVKFEIIEESDYDENDVDALRDRECYIEINADDVEEY